MIGEGGGVAERIYLDATIQQVICLIAYQWLHTGGICIREQLYYSIVLIF